MPDTLISYKLLYWFIAFYVVGVNVVAFVMFGWDKLKARKNQWRVAEKSLFSVAILGGSVGAWIGMYYFRHKTKHWYFQFGIPFILVVQLVGIGGFMLWGWFWYLTA